MAQEKSIFALEDELMVARRAWDVGEEKIPSLAAKMVAPDQHQEATEEQCEHLVHDLTFLSLSGSVLWMTITGAPLLAPLYEGMRFAATQHAKVATRLSALWVVVSLATQSILEPLPVHAPQTGVVGEMVARFWERAEWCSHLETSCSEVCDLVLGTAHLVAHLVAHLEEATR
jgi:hypothetical protein